VRLDGEVSGDDFVDGWEEVFIMRVSDPADDAIGGDDDGQWNAFGFKWFVGGLVFVVEVCVGDIVFGDVGTDIFFWVALSGDGHDGE